MAKVTIHHCSDILCVWAYIAEVRVQELRAKFADQVDLDFRTLTVFGDVAGKMVSAWGGRGGVSGYARHVRETVEKFEHVSLHPEVWARNTPSSCLPAHLCLCAARLAEQAGEVAAGSRQELARVLRHRFFMGAEDISSAAVLHDAVAEAGLAHGPIEKLLRDGRAHAQLAADMQFAKDQDVRSSPTMLFNEGRQRLTGNVGYRIIEANVRELLDRPAVGHSWC